MLPGNRFTSKLKHTVDRNAASYPGAFRFAGTSRVGELSVLLMQEGGTVGFGAGGGLGFVFMWGKGFAGFF